MNRIFSLLLSCSLLAASACRPTEAAAPTSAAAAPSGSAKEDADLGPKLPPLEKVDLVVGTGPEVKTGDRVLVHYTGTLMDGTKFDSSLDRGTPFEFVVGGGTVIEGWALGVVGMQKGGKRKLTIPPHLAYDLRGSPPKIGPNATLQFEIELVDIVEPAPAPVKAGVPDPT